MPLPLAEDKQRLKNFKDVLHQYSAPAAEELIQRREDGAIQCFACGHRCLVKPGRDGVCRVRFNDNGTLKVPCGYVGALACDPIEKKPFFHVLPGSDALTFGMLGCDFHCGYCFPGQTRVMTDGGPMTLQQAFDSCGMFEIRPDAVIGTPKSLLAFAGSGKPWRVRAVFRHPYKGRLAVIRPYYLPELRCTPDHRVYATTDPSVAPQKIHASELTSAHFLATPRAIAPAPDEPIDIDVAELLKEHRTTFRTPWKLSAAHREQILTASASGQSSREIGQGLGVSASYIRHVRSKLALRAEVESVTGAAVVEAGRIRFPKEHRPGVPCRIPLDEGLAELLGYYCAEGCVVRSRVRPNSWVLNFSFSPDEGDLVDRVIDLLGRYMEVKGRRVARQTTAAVSVGKASAALLFKSLAGSRGIAKHVPLALFDAPAPVIRAFLNAYVEGDGCRLPNGKVSVTTVAPDLAYGVAWLALRLGYMPSVYRNEVNPDRSIEGRAVKSQPEQYSVVWYEQCGESGPRRKLLETDAFYLVPVREVSDVDFEGDVFNMEVEEEHNYLAGFLLVSNCQNWVTSQMLRDPDAVAPPRIGTARELVDLAIKNRAPVVASSYNEPLITSEWAVEVFKEARSRGLLCAYISNGNGTPQVLDYIRPYVSAYKVDLKTFDPKHYRELGGVLENVTATIRMLKERNFWVEIVTLVVPGFSDDADDLKRMAEFIAEVDPLMPWHMTAFHPDYKMMDRRRTVVDDLMRIVEFGKAAGLKYMYPGNLPGQVGEWENTRCHHCNVTLIRRHGFLVTENRMKADERCPECGGAIPGIWGKASGHGDGRVRSLL